jgi:prepilin-type processing-associated H-X9-DG protein
LISSPWPAHLLPDTAKGNYNVLPKMSRIPNSSEMVWLYDGIFYNLDFSANRINARHQNSTMTNLLFFDGHAATYGTGGLPGGIGDANTPINPFNTVPIPPDLTADTSVRWRTDY